ncbi:hypothetical protein [Larkinella harenae]
MKTFMLAAVCLAIMAAPAALAQDKPAKSTATPTAVKGEKMNGKQVKHHAVVKKTETKKVEKKRVN